MKTIIVLVAALSVIGCSGEQSPSGGKDDTSIDSAEVQGELLDRWNAVVDAQWNAVASEHPAVAEVDFHWSRFDFFPHPTYFAEGDIESYHAFSHLLLVFLEDNFDYLAEHHLFDATLYSQLEFGDPATWTFHELVDQFASGEDSDPTYWAEEPIRRGLEDMATRIENAD